MTAHPRRPRFTFLKPLLCAAGLASLALGGTLWARADGPGPAQPEFDGLLVAFKDSVQIASRRDVLSQYQLRVDTRVSSPFFAKVYPTLEPGQSLADLLEALKQDPRVRIAEPDYILHALAVPNDPRYREQWQYHNTGQTGGLTGADISAETGWDKVTDASNVVVAVTDTGVDYNHPDLAANIMRDASGKLVGTDAINGDADPMDDDGHGTHCAGIIGARGNNGVGVTGVAHRVRIMPVKVLNPNGGTTSSFIVGLDFATNNGANIVNASLGGPGRDDLVLDAIKRARSKGVLCVFAAGNGGTDGVSDDNDAIPNYPSNFTKDVDNVIAVAATEHKDQLTGFSNFGATSVDVAAPGQDILSTMPGNQYALQSGTSMATPMVAGACALVWASRPSPDYAGVKKAILDGATKLPQLAGKCVTGARLNLNEALKGSLAVTSPNGGEKFLVGENVQITWNTAIVAPNERLRIELSRNGGASYPEVIGTQVPNTGSFTWLATGPGTSNARVKITSLVDPNATDTSDADFSLVVGSLSLLAPLGGESFPLGRPVEIRWNTSGFEPTDTVRIELSRDGGQTFTEVLNGSAPNTGSFMWTPSGLRAAAARIRITSNRQQSVSDESTSNFALTGAFTLTAPNGGESLVSGTPVNITWNAVGFETGDSSAVKIELSRDGGVTYETLFPNAPNTGSKTWVVSGAPTRLARLRLTPLEDASFADVSDGFFAIETPGISVTAPDRSRTLLVGRKETIRWNTTGLDTNGNVRVEVSRDGGRTWRTLSSATANDGVFNWTVTGPPSNSAVVRISASEARGISQTFAIRNPTIFVVTPNGGEQLKLGNLQTIQWSGSTVSTGTVKIELSRDGGHHWETLFAHAQNTGALRWGVRGRETNQGRVRVTWNQDRSVQDTSNRNFSIKKP